MSTSQGPPSPDERYPVEPQNPPPPPGWTYPAPPPGAGLGGAPQPPREPRPAPVPAAVVCWVFAGLVLIGSGVLTFAGAGVPEARQELERLFAESGTQVTDQMLGQLLLGAGVASLVFGVVTIALGLLLLGGSNWVRVLLTVVGVLDVLMVLFSALFVAAAVVLHFLPASNAWFRAHGARRAPA